MMSVDHASVSESGGYEIEMFLVPPAEEYLCPVCGLVLREPFQLECCGATVCESCISEVGPEHHEEDDCEETIDGILDKGIRKEIIKLIVRCNNSACYWTGELFELKNHKQKNCPLIVEEKKKWQERKKELKAKVDIKVQSFLKRKESSRQSLPSMREEPIVGTATTTGHMMERQLQSLMDTNNDPMDTGPQDMDSSAVMKESENAMEDDTPIEDTQTINNNKTLANEVQQQLNEKLLHESANGNWKEIPLLINSGASVNCQDKEGKTCLHYAAKSGIADVVRKLLSHQVDPNMPDKRKVRPLHLAARNGHVEIVKLLIIHKANINLIDTDRQTALHLASLRGHVEIVEELLKCPGVLPDSLDRRQNTALINACIRGHTEIVMNLLVHKASVEISEMYQMTPLHIAAAGGYTDIVEVLLHFDAPLDLKDEYKHTPINWALLRGHTETAETILLLSDHGVGIITDDDEWRTSTVLIATVLNNKKISDQLRQHFGITSEDIKKYELPAGWIAQTDGITHKLTYVTTTGDTKEETNIHPNAKSE